MKEAGKKGEKKAIRKKPFYFTSRAQMCGQLASSFLFIGG